MAKLDPPSKFSFKANEWEDWIADFSEYRIATELDDNDGRVQVSALMYTMGAKKAREIYSTFKYGKVTVPNPDAEGTIEVDESPEDYDVVVRKFTEHFVPKRNIIHERAIFQESTQKEEQTVEEFVRTLQTLVQTCNYADPDDQVHDRFVVGLRDMAVKQKLQLITDLSLDKAITIARQHEQVKEQLKLQSGSPSSSASIPEVSNQGYYRRGRGRGRGRGSHRPVTESQGRSHQTQPTYDFRPEGCPRCGKSQHERNQRCPASGAICHYCQARGHFAVVCRKRSVRELESDNTTTQDNYPGNIPSSHSVDETFWLNTVTCEDSDAPWMVYLPINDGPVEFKIDSGADITVMTKESYEKLPNKPSLEPSKIKLKSPGGPVTNLGEFEAHTCLEGVKYAFRVVVTEHAGSNLLSRSTASKMGLISRRIEEIEQDVFGHCGIIKTAPVKISLGGDAEPYCVTTARRVPSKRRIRPSGKVWRHQKCDGTDSMVCTNGSSTEAIRKNSDLCGLQTAKFSCETREIHASNSGGHSAQISWRNRIQYARCCQWIFPNTIR